MQTTLPWRVLVALFLVQLATALDYCPPVWTRYHLRHGTFCYRYFGRKASWSDAESTCRRYTQCGRETAHLVSVGSVEEDEFVSSYWKDMIGGSDGGNNGGIWLGYYQNATGSDRPWAWSDGLQAGYENWNPTAKGDVNPAKTCSQQVNRHNGWPVWKRAECRLKKHFLCKTPSL